jgi:hypothetical protein
VPGPAVNYRATTQERQVKATVSDSIRGGTGWCTVGEGSTTLPCALMSCWPSASVFKGPKLGYSARTKAQVQNGGQSLRCAEEPADPCCRCNAGNVPLPLPPSSPSHLWAPVLTVSVQLVIPKVEIRP